MKIIKVDIPEDRPQKDGLSFIEMDRLSQLVLLAGRNGSGKTRLLEKVKTAFQNQPTSAQIEQARINLDKYLNNLDTTQQQLAQWSDINFNSNVTGDARSRQIAQLEQNKSSWAQNVHNTESVLKNVLLHISDDSVNRNIVYFVPKKLDLRDPKSLNPNDIETRSRRTSSLGIENLHEDALSKIQDLHTQFWNATHQDSQIDPTEKGEILDEYERMRAIISLLLGTSLENDSRGAATLFGFPIGQARLSDGQKVLLQLSVAIHCQRAQLSETILMLDEPENHLHPASIIEVLETLLEKIPNGQVWVATHSVSVLAHFNNRGSLWYMDQGKVSITGKTQEKVLEGLLGDVARIALQREFLEKPEKNALVQYSQQCLCPPTAVMTGQGDPQVAQIRGVIEALYHDHDLLKVIDFGAGQGRLLANLIEGSSSSKEVSSQLSYVAYDNSENFREACESYIGKIYGTTSERWFSSYAELTAIHNKGSFHIIVMCNVLHEIPPADWNRLFGPAGELTELLTDDGQLLIVEDQRIPVGENAHEYGFIVLDTAALKDMFSIRGADQPIIADVQRDGRLKAHLIPKDYLKRVSPQTIRQALESHKRHAKSEIIRMRQSGTAENGRLFAFWLVQYANAIMALDDDLRAT